MLLEPVIDAVAPIKGPRGRPGRPRRRPAKLHCDKGSDYPYEQRVDILLGFLHLAGALICLKSLNQPKV